MRRNGDISTKETIPNKNWKPSGHMARICYVLCWQEVSSGVGRLCPCDLSGFYFLEVCFVLVFLYHDKHFGVVFVYLKGMFFFFWCSDSLIQASWPIDVHFLRGTPFIQLSSFLRCLQFSVYWWGPWAGFPSFMSPYPLVSLSFRSCLDSHVDGTSTL